MARINGLLIGILIGGILPVLPAAAQSGNGTSSLTHVVSVTIAPRVKVQVSALSLSSRNIAAAVKVTANQSALDGLALRVHANQAWVLAIKSAPTAESSTRSKLLWSTGSTSEFTPVSAADSRLAAGSASAVPLDTTVVFRDSSRRGSETADQAVVLTVSAP